MIAANNALTASLAPRQRSGYAMGVLQMSMGVGIAIGPLMGGYIADTFGYRMAFYATAALLLLSGIVVSLWVHETDSRPKEKGQPSPNFLQEWKNIFASSGVPITFVLRFLTQMGRMMVFAILAFFARELLENENQINSTVGLMMGITSGAATLSAVYLGKLGDRIGHRKILVAATAASGLVYLPQAIVTEAWQLVVLQGLAGVALGGIIPSIAALLANYTEPGHEGAVYGLDNSINSAGRSLAPLIGGLIAGWFGMRATFTSTAVLFLATSAVAYLWLPRVQQPAAEPAPAD